MTGVMLVLTQTLIWTCRHERVVTVTSVAVSIIFLLLVFAPFLVLRPVLETVISKFQS